MTLLSWLRRELSRTLGVTLMVWVLAGAGVLLYLGFSDWHQWNRMSESWVEQANFHAETRTIRQLELSSSLYLQSFPHSTLMISNESPSAATSGGPLWSYPRAKEKTPHFSMAFTRNHGPLKNQILSPSTSIFRRSLSFLFVYLATTSGIVTLGYLAIRHSIGLALNELQALHRPDRISVVKEFNEMRERVIRFEEERQRYHADAKLGRLQAQVAHDLRAPLGALSTLTSIVDWRESERQLLREVTGRIRSLAGEVLGQRRSSMIESSLDGFLRWIEAEAERQEKQITFRVNLDSLDQLPQKHREELLRHLTNLVINSIESISKAGTVTVHTHQVDGSLSIRVRDTGPGFPLQSLERIQCDLAPASSKMNGNGLAIRACQEWLQELSGSLIARNVEGGGAEVVVTLPTSLGIPASIRGTLADSS